MRVLLDECLPRRLKRHLTGHTARTVAEMGWNGLKNGALLARAEGSFDVFLTGDQNLPYQQNLAGRKLSIVILCARTNDVSDLEPLMSLVLVVLPELREGEIRRIEQS